MVGNPFRDSKKTRSPLFREDLLLPLHYTTLTLQYTARTLSLFPLYRSFSLTWPAAMQIYWNKRKFLHKKREHVDHLKNVAIDRDIRMTAIVTDFDINFTDVDGQN